MKNRKIGGLITACSAEELAHAGRWLAAELEDRQLFLQRLFTILASQAHELPEPAEVWQQLYPGKTYDDARLRKLSADLSHLLEEFLAIEAFRKDTDMRNHYLLKDINLRAPRLFPSLERKIRHALLQKPERNAAFFRLTYELELECQRHASLYKPQKKSKPHPQQSNKGSKQLTYAFDHWWMMEKLALSTFHISKEQRDGTPTADPFISELIDYINRHPDFAQEACLHIYKEAYLQLAGKSDKPIYALIEAINSNKEKLKPAQLNALGTMLLNYFIRQLNETADEQICRHIYLLYRWALDDGWIYSSHILPVNHYKNIVTICLKIHAYEEAWEYLHSLKASLPNSLQEEAFDFNMGTYYFMTQSFHKVVEYLNARRFTHPFFEINARILLLQAYYELADYDLEWLLSKTHLLMRYIRKQRPLSAYHKQAYLNRLKCFKGLLLASKPSDLRALKSKIQQTNPIDHREWLLEKITESLSA